MQFRSPSRPIVVVGAGIAGLSAAYELSRGGIPVLVLERAPRAGGLILTERIDGFLIDGGPDSLLVQKPAAIALCRELGLGDRLLPTCPPRTAFILRGGRLHPLPEASVLGIPTRVAPLAGTRLFTWPGKLRMAMEALVPPSRGRTDESIGSFMRRRFGCEAVDYLAEPLMAGIHAGDVDLLSLASAFPRFREIERTRGSLIRALRSLARPPSADGVFRSLPGGIGEMVDAILRALAPGIVRCGAGVAAIEGPWPGRDPRTPGAGRIGPSPSTRLGAGKLGPYEPSESGGAGRQPSAHLVRLDSGDTIEASAIVLATPAYAAADLVAPVDAELAALCRAVPYASTSTVALGYPRDAVRHPLNGSGFIVPRVERATRIMAASWMSSKWPGRAPEGHVLMRAFVGGMRNPELFELDDEAVAALAHRDLSRLLGIDRTPSLVRVYRWPRSNAQHNVGHLERMARIDARLREFPGLFVTGSGFRGTGIPDCVEDGRAVARQAAEYVVSTTGTSGRGL